VAGHAERQRQVAGQIPGDQRGNDRGGDDEVRGDDPTSVVTTLLVQHARSRVLTQFILAHAVGGMANASTRTQLAAAMQAFVRMYEPHEAREDTVVFPAFRQVVPAQEFADLGQQFAELEHQQFGVNEFAAMVARVASIEQNLGIYDLGQFTPQVSAFAPEA